jgi:flagellar biosynthesis protein FlhB
MADESYSDKTEQATPRRREEARRKGQVTRSREIPSVMVLMTGLLTLSLSGSYVVRQCSVLVAQGLVRMETFSLHPASVDGLCRELIQSLFVILAPVFAALVVAAVLSNVLQGGNVLSFERIRLDLSKLSLLGGMKRFFSKQSVVELLKSFFKLLIVGWVAFSTIEKELPNVTPLVGQELNSIFRYIVSISYTLCIKTVLMMILIAGLDYFFQRWTFEKSLRMTKQEMSDESKTTEGNPLIKSRIRSIQRELARRRMMADVPKADVIVTNPVHLAIALHYKSKDMVAPKVVAKGAGYVAEKIKEVGRTHHIPIIENKILAQTLFKKVEIGEIIPSSLYQVVADVLAYVYRMKNKTL